MKDLIFNFLKKYAADRGVWVAISTMISHFVCKKLGMESAAVGFADLLTSACVWAVTHFLHVKVVENKLDKGVDVQNPPKEENPLEKDFNVKG